jgi:Tfp pilus assembly protein PilX
MSTTFPRRSRTSSAQRGSATIFITIVLVLAIWLIALYTNRSAVMEQRLSANEIRTKQAFAAANAGLDYSLAYMRDKGGLDHNGDGVVDSLAPSSSTPYYTMSSTGTTRDTYYQVAYCDTSATIPACPTQHSTALTCTAPTTTVGTVRGVACGWSDDDSSVQRISQLFAPTPSLAGGISTPLISKGVANFLTGGASVFNYFNDLTVWSGGAMTGQSNTGKTFVRDIANYASPYDSSGSAAVDYRNTGNSPGCNNPPTGYSCSTQGSTLGHDTVSGDTNLSSMSSDGFFQFFFGQSESSYKDGADLVTTGSGLSNISGNPRVIWVDGDADLPSVGTQADPVILIVNGNLTMNANSVVNGLVYAAGTVTGHGSPTIYGALIAAGDANVTGNPKLIYDPAVLGGVTKLGKAAKLAGTWRDW